VEAKKRQKENRKYNPDKQNIVHHFHSRNGICGRWERERERQREEREKRRLLTGLDEKCDKENRWDLELGILAIPIHIFVSKGD
jgi:hypothetical protein